MIEELANINFRDGVSLVHSRTDKGNEIGAQATKEGER